MFSGLSFLNNENDDLLSGAAANSKSNLAEMFESDGPSGDKPDESAASLKYVPPKSNSTNGDKSNWNVVIAKVVTAYRLVNGENISAGRIGLALLTHSANGSYKMILYKTKELILSSTLINPSAKIYWTPPYLQFHDDNNNFWSLLFLKTEDSDEILSYLGTVCSIGGLDVAQEKEPLKEPVASGSHSFSEKPMESTEKTRKPEKPETPSTSTPKVNSDLVDRIAKIGLQLPKMTASSDDGSNSSLITKQFPSHVKSLHEDIIPEVIPKEQSRPISMSDSMHSLDTVCTLNNAFAQETRIQNVELRMNLLKMDTKMDRILDNIERLQFCASKNATQDHDKEEEMIKMLEQLVDLKKENRLLKSQVNRLEQENQVDTGAMEQLAALQRSNEEKDTKIIDLESQIKDLGDRLGTQAVSKVKEDEKFQQMATELEQLRQELKEKDAALAKISNQGEEKKEKTNNEVVLGIMNQLYVKIYQSIDGKEPMISADLLKLIAEIIRKETKAALNQN